MLMPTQCQCGTIEVKRKQHRFKLDEGAWYNGCSEELEKVEGSNANVKVEREGETKTT